MFLTNIVSREYVWLVLKQDTHLLHDGSRPDASGEAQLVLSQLGPLLGLFQLLLSLPELGQVEGGNLLCFLNLLLVCLDLLLQLGGQLRHALLKSQINFIILLLENN